MKNINDKTAQKQGGFVLIGLVITLLVVGILAIGIFKDGKGLQSGVLQDQVISETKLNFPAAINDCLKLNTDLSNCTTARITIASTPISSTTTSCGDTWSSTQSAASVVVVYPLDQCSGPDIFGAELAADLTSIYKISASYNAGTDDLTITYSR